MKTKIDMKQFFDDEKFSKEVKLTQEEVKLLNDFELRGLYANGLDQISGGFTFIKLEEFDEEYSNIILGVVKSGIQDGDEDSVYTDKIIFNRERKTIVFA